MPTLVCAAGRVPRRDPEEGPGNSRHECQDEDVGGTAPGLSETHRRPQGVPLRQGGALQHAAGRLRGAAPKAGREEQAHREEDPAVPAR